MDKTIAENKTTIPFKKLFKFEEKEYTELTLDLESLSGQDVMDAEREVRSMGDRTAMLELSKLYQAVMAGKAAGVPVDLIKALPAKEFSRVTGEVASFFMD